MRDALGLLDERELLALRGVEPALDRVGLLELLEREHEQLGVVLVRQGRERDRRKLSALEPVDDRGVDGDGLLGRDVRPVLEVRVLALLLGLEVQPREPAEVLLGDGLVDRRAPADALAVVVRDRRPPVRLGLDVAQDDVLDRGGLGRGEEVGGEGERGASRGQARAGRGGTHHAGDAPRDVGLPAPPGLHKNESAGQPLRGRRRSASEMREDKPRTGAEGSSLPCSA